MTMTPASRLRDERGIALILTLFLTAAVSLVAASVITLSMSETTASLNYRMMSQARYAAESGVHRTINYMMNTYVPPAATGSDLLSAYNITSSPTYNGAVVYLSSDPARASNYPDATKVTAFQSATSGNLTAGTATLTYNASAQLMSMRTFASFGGGSTVIQTWLVTANGGISGSSAATVQVTSTLERQIIQATSYAAFATGSGCGSLNFNNNASTNSYDSANLTLSGGVPVLDPNGTNAGDLGTNGNLSLSNNATIRGSLSTPRTGTGSCLSGNPSAATLSNNANLLGNIITLAQPVSYTTPVVSPVPPVTNLTIGVGTVCLAITSQATWPGDATCSGLAGNLTITPGSSPVVLGNVTLSNNASLRVAGGSYNFNSLTLSNNAALILQGAGSVVVNVQGTGVANPVNFSNNSVFTNSSWDASRVSFIYPGTSTLTFANNSNFVGTIFAPNAPLNLANNGNFYGSVVGSTVLVSNNGDIFYDRKLAAGNTSVGNWMLSSFNWRKF